MNVRLKYSTYFTAGVFYNGQVILNNYKVLLYLLTGESSGEEHNVALERIKFFIHHKLANGIFINQSNVAQCQLMMSAGIKSINLPEEPVDQIVGMMLYSKLNAITEGRLLITDVELSSDLGEQIAYLHCDDENLGPLDSDGWWNLSDTSYCDVQLIDDKVVTLGKTELWKSLGLDWTHATEEEFQDNKLVFADFIKDETK